MSGDPVMSRLSVACYTNDVCVNLDTEVLVPNLLGILTAVGVIQVGATLGGSALIVKFMFGSPSFPERLTDQCLYQVEIPIFLETSFVGILVVAISGETTTTDALEKLGCGRRHLPDLIGLISSIDGAMYSL
jgi:hypothetical protein